jgi:hypothetical protein
MEADSRAAAHHDILLLCEQEASAHPEEICQHAEADNPYMHTTGLTSGQRSPHTPRAEKPRLLTVDACSTWPVHISKVMYFTCENHLAFMSTDACHTAGLKGASQLDI